MKTTQVRALLGSLWRGRVPGQLVIQLTDRCNAMCPQCGMRASEAFPRSRLSMDDVRRILDCAAERGVAVVSFTGGEPFLFPEALIALIKHAGQAGIRYIRTGTNGFIFLEKRHKSFESHIKRMAESLAATPLRNLWISIDSAVPEVHEKMRGFPGVIGRIEKALPIFHDFGIYPSANLGINRNMGGESPVPPLRQDRDLSAKYSEFRQGLRAFYDFVVNLGFTTVNVCYPMSVDDSEKSTGLHPVYGATSTDSLVRFSEGEKGAIFQALLDTVPEFRNRIRVFSPLSSVYALCRRYGRGIRSVYPCLGGKDFFFIDARDGDTYPCGYRGLENFGKFWNPDWHSPGKGPCTCLRCDWECFRDPSELFGPLLHARATPLGLAASIHKDPSFYRYWLDDIRYYLACDLFDGRKPPNYRKLRIFGSKNQEPPLTVSPASPALWGDG